MTTGAAEAQQADWRRPTPLSTALFAAKVLALQARRVLLDQLGGPPRRSQYPLETDWQVLGASRTPLLSDTRPEERAYQLGKIENLRQAARRLNGVVLNHPDVFSFWRQVGPATSGRGFVVGRMLQQGCLVPATGGGLCQLSNAIYEVALQSGCEIVERHAHSRVVPGSAAEFGRDATVAWNYVDLRFRAPQRLQLHVGVENEELVVLACSPEAARRTALEPGSGRQASVARSCATCDETSCFRHESGTVRR
jgi:hypothetical protein